ncbi:serine/threonine-protein phosphatase 4 regulatory subunit 2-like [Haemaphysalis longicornis]
MDPSKEAVLDGLTNFANRQPAQIPYLLEEYLAYVAKTGDTVFPWDKVRPLLRRKLELVMEEFRTVSTTDEVPALPNVPPFNYEEMKDFILEAIDRFDGAPFTVQRLCELLVDPWRNYNRIDKYMRAVEKSVLVVSTIEPRSLAQQANAPACPAASAARSGGDGSINGRFAGNWAEWHDRVDWEREHCE